MKTHRKPTQAILSSLADNVRHVRKVRGYTQRELASLSLLTTTYISNVEQATVNICLANLEQIARGLGCSEARLLLRGGAPELRVAVAKLRTRDVRRVFALLNLLCTHSRRAAFRDNDTLESYRRLVAQTSFQARDLLRERATGVWPADPTDEDLNEVQP